MLTCSTHKRVFLTRQIAEDALIEAWNTYIYAPNTGPIAIYKCDDCGYYHFTSQGKMEERLAEALASGKVKQQREANHWLNKMKK